MNRQVKASALFAALLIGSLFASGFVLAESGKNLKVSDRTEFKYDDSYLDASLKVEDSTLVEDGLLEKSILAKTEAGLDNQLYRGYPLQAYWGKGWSIDADKKEGNLVDFLIAQRIFVHKNGTTEETRVLNGALRVGGMLYVINEKKETSDSILSQNSMQLEVKGRNSVTGTLKLEKKSSYTNFGLWEGSLTLSDGTEMDLSLALKERQADPAARTTRESSVEEDLEKACGQYRDSNEKYDDCKEAFYKEHVENSRAERTEQKQERGWYKFFNRMFGRSEAKLEVKTE